METLLSLVLQPKHKIPDWVNYYSLLENPNPKLAELIIKEEYINVKVISNPNIGLTDYLLNLAPKLNK